MTDEAPVSASSKPGRRRRIVGSKGLVADPKQTIEVEGQTLTRVQRAEEDEEAIPPTAPSRKLEAVVQKHIARVLDDEGPPSDPPPSSLPDLEDVINSTVIEGEMAIPPAEPDPRKREQPTLGEIRLTGAAPDFTSDTKPKTFLDLFSSFSIGDGNYFIYVERIQPRSYQGLSCAGAQRPIRHPISLGEFGRDYGGGDYKLIVYGPPKNGFGPMGPDGRMQPKALTDAIRFVYPGPPSLLMMDATDEVPDYEGISMTPMQHLHGRATPADATIETKRLEQKNLQEERRERRERERLEEEKNRVRSAEETALEREKMLLEQHERELERRREDEKERHAQELERRAELDRMVKEHARVDPNVMELMKIQMQLMSRPQDEGKIESLLAAHRTEIAQLTKNHDHALERAEARNRDEHERAERRVADAERRAEERVKTLEERATDRIREAESRCDRSLEEIRRRAEKDVEDIRRICDQRVTDEARNHQRDLDSQRSAYEARLESVRGSYELQLTQRKESEQRLQSDLQQAKKEATEGRDLGKQIAKVKSMASELGLQEQQPESEMDWKTMGMQVVGSLAQNLPGLVQSVTEALRSRQMTPAQIEQFRHQQQQQMLQASHETSPALGLPPPLRQRGQPRPQQVFATENGPETTPGGPIVRIQPARFPGEQLVSAPPNQALPAFSTPQPLPLDPMPSSAPPAPPAPPPPMPMPPPPPTPQPAPSGPTVPGISDEELSQLVGLLQVAFDSGTSSQMVANTVVGQIGPENARGLAQTLTPEHISAIIYSRPGGDQSSLTRHQGQKYIREIIATVRQLTATK